MTKRNSVTLILTWVIQLSVSHAQDGTLDTSFDSDGIVTMDIDNSNDVMKSIVIQPNGKIIVAGFTSDLVTDNFCMIRMNTDGSIDSDFGPNGIVITNFPFSAIASDVALQMDGKIVLAGHTWGGTDNEFAIARYNSNGILDSTFGNAGIVSTPFTFKSAIARSLKIQNNGKIIAGGHTYTIGNDFDEFALVRYNVNGALDTTFGIGGLVTTSFGAGTRNWINSIQLQDDEKILVGGFSDNSFALARYTSDGTLDPTFGTGGLVSTTIPNTQMGLINSLAINTDGSILGAGFSVGSYSDFTIAKYDSLGNLDNTFGNNGIMVTQFSAEQDGIADMKVQADNKLIVAGSAVENNVFQFALARFDVTGNPDPTFGTNGVVRTALSPDFNQLEAIAVQGDGNILATGFIGDYPYDIGVARYTSTVISTIDQEFFLEPIFIYPNPTTDKINIVYSTNSQEAFFIKLYNDQGQLIQEKIKPFTKPGIKNTETFQLHNYPPGIYFISIGTAEFSQTFKFVKE